jgi:hypothetical protein
MIGCLLSLALIASVTVLASLLNILSAKLDRAGLLLYYN